MEFHVGDPVMHWTYGLGNIIGIEERIISGAKNLYYVVGIRDLTIWVPIDGQVANRLRSPTSAGGFKQLFSILAGPGEPLPMDRQERKLHLVEWLKDGRAESLCRVIRDLSIYQQVHPLNENDQNLMKRARTALLGEWGFALSISVIEAEAELHRILTFGISGELVMQ